MPCTNHCCKLLVYVSIYKILTFYYEINIDPQANLIAVSVFKQSPLVIYTYKPKNFCSYCCPRLSAAAG